MKKILITTTSFQDTPGKHQELLNAQNFELTRLRGPISEEVLLPIIQEFEGIICGDDEYSEAVIKKGAAAGLKVISKYGVGLDSIDLNAARKFGVTITNVPSVNQTSVSEHVLGLLFSFYRNIPQEYNYTKMGKWTRLSGEEISGKKIAVLGLGSVGKETALKAKALGLNVLGFDIKIDTEWSKTNNISVTSDMEKLFAHADILSLHLPLNEFTENIISEEVIYSKLPKGALIVNTARAKLIHLDSLYKALSDGRLSGYLTDVLEVEPMIDDHPLLKFDNVIITPHIGSRTLQSVQKQGIGAVKNLINNLSITNS